MRTLVFQPTRLFGGVDVLWQSVVNQNVGVDVLVLDQHYEARGGMEFWGDVGFDYGMLTGQQWDAVFLPFKDGAIRNLAGCYNYALTYARENEYDLLVSLQDYFWIARDGVQKFQKLAEEVPSAIYSGLANLYRDPYDDRVVDKTAAWSIFAPTFHYERDEPKDMWWRDPRVDQVSSDAPCIGAPVYLWESNWAAIGPGVLADETMVYDEAFDRAGCAFENQDFAALCIHDGYPVVFDPTNLGKGLDHKRWWREIETREEPLTAMNRELMRVKWGI